MTIVTTGQVAQEHGYDDVRTDEEVYGKGAKRAVPDDDETFFSHLATKARAMNSCARIFLPN